MTALANNIEDKGYSIVDGVFDSTEIATLSKALSTADLLRTRAGARHAMRNAAVSGVARDARLTSIVCLVLGSKAEPFRATLFDKSSVANWLVVWHQDTALPLRRRLDKPGWGPWSVKAGVDYAHAPTMALQQVLALRIHLDDSGALNGPLRVLPGTHQSGVLTDDDVQKIARHAESVECLVLKGGVLAMRPLLIHASSKSRIDMPRRVLHIEYAASLNIDPDLELAVA